MPKRLSEKTFYQYLKCPTWVYFDAHQAERAHDALLSKLIDDGLLPEIERELLSDRQFVEVENDDEDDAFQRTLELMKAGEQTILHGVLMRGHWVGHPDILERVEGASSFGDYYYVACDMKRDRHLQDVYKFQGAFYGELLRLIQGTKPTQGYVMDPERRVQAYILDEVQTEFHLTIEEIEKILAGQKPPHFLTSGCKQSPWFGACKEESLVCDDLSLLNRIWRSEVQALHQAGIHTLKQLAVADPDMLSHQLSALTRERLHWLRMQAVALTEGRTIIMDAIDFPRADVEVYFDIESSPVRDLEFLFGVLVVEKGTESYHSFVAKKAGEEAKAFLDFLTFLEAYPQAIIYHFGYYEVEVLRRLGGKYGKADVCEKIIDEQMHDLLLLIRDQIIFPLYFYSLKDIAKLVGFSWRKAEVSGINAVVWYEEYLRSRRKQKLQDIIDYNEDDCRATYVVKKWCQEKAGE